MDTVKAVNTHTGGLSIRTEISIRDNVTLISFLTTCKTMDIHQVIGKVQFKPKWDFCHLTIATQDLYPCIMISAIEIMIYQLESRNVIRKY